MCKVPASGDKLAYPVNAVNPSLSAGPWPPFLPPVIQSSPTCAEIRNSIRRGDFFTQREANDDSMCIFQYDTQHGATRAFHQSLTSINDPEIGFEKFIGPDATIPILGAGERTEIRNKTSADDSGHKLAELEKRGVLPRSSKIPCYLQQENMDA